MSGNTQFNVKKPELLSPAGSLAALRAAVAAGADAVYFGGNEFSARANAKNFTRDELKYAISLCRERGVKTNITANTLVLDKELSSWLEYAEFLWQAGADAMIVADLGAAAELHRRIPEFALHASTQAGICDVGGAKLAADMGFSRVVLSRELDSGDIRKITERCGIETEMFIHGALCVSVSGQCLFSSMVGGRSGNRGECAQPCRLAYNNGGYLLSLKDCCIAEHIPEVLTLGVSSLKIEGRMKPPEYVYGVTKIYRRLLDEGRAPERKELSELEACFSRSGFTDAYYTGGSHAGMLGIRTDADKAKRASVKYSADSSPASAVVFPVRELPESAGGKLILQKKQGEKGKKTVSLQFLSAKQLRECKLPPNTDNVFLPLGEFIKHGGKNSGANGVAIPPVFFEREAEQVRSMLGEAVKLGAEVALAESLGAIHMAKEVGIKIAGGMHLNVYNSLTAELLCKIGVATPVMSPELTLPQTRDINRAVASSQLAYGRLPLMLLTRCVLKGAIGCSACGYDTAESKWSLKDRMGVRFPVLPEFGHRNTVLNSLPTYVGGQGKELAESGLGHFTFIFTAESGADCEKILKSFFEGRDPDFPVRRAGIRKTVNERKNDGKSNRNRHGQLQHPSVRKGQRDTRKGAFRGGNR